MTTTVVYTDGATSNNGREGAKGGVGVWFGVADPRNVSEPFEEEPITNQRCELMAIRRAIESAGPFSQPSGHQLLIKTDSKYAIGCLTEWIHNWERNDFVNSKGEPVKNAELIKSIRLLMTSAPFSVQFEYVKGHATGDSPDAVGNRHADQLAVAGRGGDAIVKPQPQGIRVALCHPKAKLPTRGSPQSAGLDLYAAEDVLLNAGRMACIETGIKIALPENFYGRVAPRSGLAFRHQIDVFAGVIDRDYRDTIKVLLKNFGRDPLEIRVGMRIAQLVVERICEWPVVQVESIDDASERGTGGFGSTGV